MGFLTTLLMGPATGLLGSLFGGVMKYFEKKQEMEAQAIKQAHEVTLLQMNIAARGEEMENEAMIAQVAATADMVSASYQHDASYGTSNPWINGALRMIRPILTIGLIALTTLIFLKANEAEQSKIILTVLYMTEVAVTWWFADRARGSKK